MENSFKAQYVRKQVDKKKRINLLTGISFLKDGNYADLDSFLLRTHTDMLSDIFTFDPRKLKSVKVDVHLKNDFVKVEKYIWTLLPKKNTKEIEFKYSTYPNMEVDEIERFNNLDGTKSFEFEIRYEEGNIVYH